MESASQTSLRWIAALAAAVLMAAGCQAASEGQKPALDTSCFTTSPDFTLPTDYVTGSLPPDSDACEFVVQAEGLADTTVIAGELRKSSAGQSFEDFVSLALDDLGRGQEPDLLPLRLLNSGASGRDLPVLERQELSSPNRAVIFTHESDRRRGFTALTAVVEVPTPGAETTQAIFMWGFSTPINDELIVEMIDSMDVRALEVD